MPNSVLIGRRKTKSSIGVVWTGRRPFVLRSAFPPSSPKFHRGKCCFNFLCGQLADTDVPVRGFSFPSVSHFSHLFRAMVIVIHTGNSDCPAADIVGAQLLHMCWPFFLNHAGK